MSCYVLFNFHSEQYTFEKNSNAVSVYCGFYAEYLS